MKEKIDFKKVANTVRFDMLGSILLPTPSDYERLCDGEKKRVYQYVFETFHDVCCYISSSLDLDKLATKYEEINSLVCNENNAADE